MTAPVVAVGTESVFPLPDALSFEQGAALLAAILDDLDEQVSVALGKNAMRPQPGTSR